MLEDLEGGKGDVKDCEDDLKDVQIAEEGDSFKVLSLPPSLSLSLARSLSYVCKYLTDTLPLSLSDARALSHSLALFSHSLFCPFSPLFAL